MRLGCNVDLVFRGFVLVDRSEVVHGRIVHRLGELARKLPLKVGSKVMDASLAQCGRPDSTRRSLAQGLFVGLINREPTSSAAVLGDRYDGGFYPGAGYRPSVVSGK